MKNTEQRRDTKTFMYPKNVQEARCACRTWGSSSL